MTLNKAIDRLYWRIKTGIPKATENKHIKTDLDAIDSVVDYLNESQKQTITENLPFTKMYVYLFAVLLERYEDLYLAQNELNRILDTKTIDIYKQFSDKLNHNELKQFLDIHDIELKHPAIETPEEKENVINQLKENNEDFYKYAFGFRNFDEVRNNLNNQVALAFNRFHLKE